MLGGRGRGDCWWPGLIAFVCSSRRLPSRTPLRRGLGPHDERERVGQQGSKICQHPFDCLAVIQKGGMGKGGGGRGGEGEAGTCQDGDAADGG